MLSPERLAFVSEVCSQWKIWKFSAQSPFFYTGFFEGSEIVPLQLHSLYLNNSKSKNDRRIAFEPTKPDKNSGFLCSWSNKSYCNWWAWELRACNFLGSVAIFGKPQQWPKAHCCEFQNEFWLESFFVNRRLPSNIGPNYPKSADLGLY